MRSRITTYSQRVCSPFGFGSFLTANSASATEGAFCLGTSGLYCLNAWNGGPDVNVYSNGALNDTFNLYFASGGNVVLQAYPSPPNKYSGDCIGNSNNNQYIARAGLWSNCTTGGQGAWGVAFKLYLNCPNNEFAFKNNHWGGWLAPANFSNGAPFYLNNPTEYCFTEY